MQVGDKVIAKKDKCEVVFAGQLYTIESSHHPSLGDCGLIKLEGVRDYWDKADFVNLQNYQEIKHETK